MIINEKFKIGGFCNTCREGIEATFLTYLPFIWHDSEISIYRDGVVTFFE